MDQSIIYISVGVIAVVFIIGFIFSKKSASKMNDKISKMRDLKSEYPDISRLYVYTKFSKTGMGSDTAIKLFAINDTKYMAENATKFDVEVEGNNWQLIMDEINKDNYQGFYIVPGETKLRVQYVTSRDGVLYDKVTKYTKPHDITFNFEPNKNYLLNFDTDLLEFTFNEYRI